MRSSLFKLLIFVVAELLFLFATNSVRANATDTNEIKIVKVNREGTPLYLRSDGGEFARQAAFGEEFAYVDRIDTYIMIKDEVTGSFLFIDQIDVTFAKTFKTKEDAVAYERAPDDDWNRLESTFFAIEDETTTNYHSGRYEANRTYVPRVNPEKFISSAKKYSGVRYKWGGESTKGIDCSGLIMRCLNDQGFSITHKASIQAKFGLYVAFDSLRPGDVLFFTDKKDHQIGHTGIYLGGGKFIHAASSLGKVGISSIHEDYYSNHLALARRY